MIRRVVTAGLLATMACSSSAPKAIPVASVAVSATSTSLLVGGTAQLSARVIGADGNAIDGAPVTYVSVTPSIITVTPTGAVTALAAGSGTARASSGGKSGDLSVTVVNPPVASLRFDRDSAVLALPSGTVTLVPQALDALGHTINNPTVFFSSDAPRVATVTQLGVVTAVAAGTAVISGTTESFTATSRIRVTANATGTSPRVTTVTAMIPGGTATITGSNFSSSVSGNTVLIEGVPVTVTAATTTQLNITLPAGGWACSADRSVIVQVNANNESGVGTGTLRTAVARSLAVGQSLVFTTASDSRCNELSTTGGSYLVTVFNASRVLSGGDAAFALRGAASGVAAQVASQPAARAVAMPTYPSIGSARFSRLQELTHEQQSDAAHASVMERSLAFARSMGSPIAALRRMRASTEAATPLGGALARQVATVGSITPIKIPNLDATNFCVSNIPVGVRTVWVGQHAIIVEDTTSSLNGTPTLKGQIDSLYALVGQEFDTVMWPVLTQDFGNPLAMDAQLSSTGKEIMVFSPRINQMAGGSIAGFVVSCDFYPVSQAPSSNVGEYFYAESPTSLVNSYSIAGSRETWMRTIRSTIIHESKHITAFGERYSRGLAFEEIWLEEGLARHAEEQYARVIYGVPWKANTGYQNSVYCDVRPSNASAPQCTGRPILMLRHFDALYGYLQNPLPYSIIGRVSAGDGSFYGTSWSIVRWMMDQYSASEPATLNALVQSSQTGIANLEARSGHLWDEMLGEWALSLYTDDYPGVSFANTRLKFPSWNVRDEFRGLCSDFGPCTNTSNTSQLYPVEYPLSPRAFGFGAFTDAISSLNAASFASWRISGTQTAPQIIELRGANGGDPPSQLRVAIVRLQ